MVDYTRQILLGLDAKAKMKADRKMARTKARAAFETQVAAYERDLFAEAEGEFAGAIKRLHDGGVPGGVIRREILGTNDWGTWVHWRDLAGVESETTFLERQRRENLEGTRPYRVEEGKVIVTRNEEGPVDEFTLEGLVWQGDTATVFAPHPGEDRDNYLAAFGDIQTLMRFLNAAFTEYEDRPEGY